MFSEDEEDYEHLMINLQALGLGCGPEVQETGGFSQGEESEAHIKLEEYLVPGVKDHHYHNHPRGVHGVAWSRKSLW